MGQLNKQPVRIDRYGDGSLPPNGSLLADFGGSSSLTLDTSGSDYVVDKSSRYQFQDQYLNEQQRRLQQQERQLPQLPVNKKHHQADVSPLSPSPRSSPRGTSEADRKKIRHFFRIGGGGGNGSTSGSNSGTRPVSRDSAGDHRWGEKKAAAAPAASAGPAVSAQTSVGRLSGSSSSRYPRPLSHQILPVTATSTTITTSTAKISRPSYHRSSSSGGSSIGQSNNYSVGTAEKKALPSLSSSSTVGSLARPRARETSATDATAGGDPRPATSRPHNPSQPTPVVEAGSGAESLSSFSYPYSTANSSTSTVTKITAAAIASATAAAKNPSFRHSIAILPVSEPRPSLQQRQQSHHSPPSHSPESDSSPARAPYSVFNSSSTQPSDIDNPGSKSSSAWNNAQQGRRRYEQHQRYQHSSRPADNAGHEDLSDGISIPSPRVSIERSVADQSQYIGHHPRAALSQSSISKLDISRDPSPLPQAPTLQRGQSSQSQGNYGNNLDVDTTNKRPLSKQLGMVQNSAERGSTPPPPNKSKEDLASLDHSALVSKHEELNEKYRKVKKYYFEKDAQVQNLQNTLAHQRLSQSRTSLDDNEYSNRFSRLDGAINNLAFNVRKDWKAVPPWLSPYVNSDAATSKSKEMTAVGRACISRWLVDEIFDRVFHPGLEPNLSSNLKIIERNLRRFAPPVSTDEERDTLLTKISNWRLATLDGLAEALNSPAAGEYRNELTRGLVETLTSDLQMNLNTPSPPNLEAGVVGIIELAVGIAANLPLESRDVYVEYILPGFPLNDAYMKVEGSLPPLTNPGEAYAIDGDPAMLQQQQQQQHHGSGDDVSTLGEEVVLNPPIGGFIGAGPREPRKGNSSNGQGKKGDEEKKEAEKIRFAAFMSVMVKGKSMLQKAPVFT